MTVEYDGPIGTTYTSTVEQPRPVAVLHQIHPSFSAVAGQTFIAMQEGNTIMFHHEDVHYQLQLRGNAIRGRAKVKIMFDSDGVTFNHEFVR